MCPLRGIKCAHLILGVLLPKHFGGEKRSFHIRHFETFFANISRLEQDIVDRKTELQLRSLSYMPTKYGELWSTNGEMGPAFQSIQWQGGHQAGLCHAF